MLSFKDTGPDHELSSEGYSGVPTPTSTPACNPSDSTVMDDEGLKISSSDGDSAWEDWRAAILPSQSQL